MKQIIKIRPIKLEWSNWASWGDLEVDGRKKGAIKVPNKEPGVYEAKYTNKEIRLTIGRASDLRMRIKQGLVKGKSEHSAGKKIRKNEDTQRIVVRWAITCRPAAAEEELHRRHKSRFGELPEYVEHT